MTRNIRVGDGMFDNEHRNMVISNIGRNSILCNPKADKNSFKIKCQYWQICQFLQIFTGESLSPIFCLFLWLRNKCLQMLYKQDFCQ